MRFSESRPRTPTGSRAWTSSSSCCRPDAVPRCLRAGRSSPASPGARAGERRGPWPQKTRRVDHRRHESAVRHVRRAHPPSSVCYGGRVQFPISTDSPPADARLLPQFVSGVRSRARSRFATGRWVHDLVLRAPEPYQGAVPGAASLSSAATKFRSASSAFAAAVTRRASSLEKPMVDALWRRARLGQGAAAPRAARLPDAAREFAEPRGRALASN